MKNSQYSPSEFELAKPGIRYLAAGLDYITLMGFTEFLYKVSHRNSWIIILFVVLWFAYFPLMESFRGQTLWKVVLRLQVVRTDGAPANLFDTFIRRLFDIIDFLPIYGLLGLIVASRSRGRQRIGDKMARTIVVKKLEPLS